MRDGEAEDRREVLGMDKVKEGVVPGEKELCFLETEEEELPEDLLIGVETGLAEEPLRPLAELGTETDKELEGGCEAALENEAEFLLLSLPIGTAREEEPELLLLLLLAPHI